MKEGGGRGREGEQRGRGRKLLGHVRLTKHGACDQLPVASTLREMLCPFARAVGWGEKGVNTEVQYPAGELVAHVTTAGQVS